jgi:hypothetical protein
MISLLDSGFIWFENESLMWDGAKLDESNTVSSSLTSIFSSKINALPEACKRVLMVRVNQHIHEDFIVGMSVN